MRKPRKSYALPLPALTNTYVRAINGVNGAAHLLSNHFAPPLQFEVEEDESLVAPPPVNHPYALYSVGVAELDPVRGPKRLLQNRPAGRDFGLTG